MPSRRPFGRVGVEFAWHAQPSNQTMQPTAGRFENQKLESRKHMRTLALTRSRPLTRPPGPPVYVTAWQSVPFSLGHTTVPKHPAEAWNRNHFDISHTRRNSILKHRPFYSMSPHFAVVHSHADSVLPLRIFFSVCLVIVIFAGLYIFRNR
jgi:hypothetical protein